MPAGETRTSTGDKSGMLFLESQPRRHWVGSGLLCLPQPLSLSPPMGKEFGPCLVGLWVLVGLGWKALQKEEEMLALRG